jgi:hypothetical protein
MDHIVRVRSNGAATKCTSEFEDPGFANALVDKVKGMMPGGSDEAPRGRK